MYLIGSGLTAATPRGGYWFIFLYITRVVAGMGIGGEYAAINSAIDEMIPAKYRGRVDLAVNGTYWAGAFPALWSRCTSYRLSESALSHLSGNVVLLSYVREDHLIHRAVSVIKSRASDHHPDFRPAPVTKRAQS